MDIPLPAPSDPRHQAASDRRRFRRAALLSLLLVALLWWIKGFELLFDTPLGALGVRPGQPWGLIGLLSGPLLHGSIAHLLANTLPLALLFGLAVSTVPRALARALPLIWLGSGLFVWFTGQPGSNHLGASGLTHGLMFFLFLLGLLRRDRPAIATALLVFFLYGGMLLTVFPREVGISWQYHLGGALTGMLAALLWRRLDPAPVRPRCRWEDGETETVADAELEPARPNEVPVLWRREPPPDGPRGQVLAFRPRAEPGDADEHAAADPGDRR
jgi:membrane associated rhomboid family serine protease